VSRQRSVESILKPIKLRCAPNKGVIGLIQSSQVDEAGRTRPRRLCDPLHLGKGRPIPWVKGQKIKREVAQVFVDA
jgi:hypothetical protein